MQPKSRLLPTLIVGLAGAVIGSFAMMLFASTHFTGVAGVDHTPPAVSAAVERPTGGSDQARIIAAIKHVTPSVVAIDVTVNGQQFVPSDPFAQLFGQGSPGRIQRFQAQASGSGFVFARNGNNGFIVTNAHVVNPPAQGTVSKIEVVFKNGDKVPGTVYATNLARDLALIRVANYAKLPPPLELADSDKLEQGQFAIAIGEPFELKQSVSLGIVSGFHRDETIGNDEGGAQQFTDLLQTSAPINPGNSGGPLVDLDGRVIGVNQSTASPQAGAQGIGFAIPSNAVRQVAQQLESDPGVHQGTNAGFIGVELTNLTPQIRTQLNNYLGTGAVVAQVVPNSPADKAGLNQGDVIQSVDGKSTPNVAAAIAAIKTAKPGQTLELEVWSGGSRKAVSVKAEERPAAINVPQPGSNP